MKAEVDKPCVNMGSQDFGTRTISIERTEAIAEMSRADTFVLSSAEVETKPIVVGSHL